MWGIFAFFTVISAYIFFKPVLTVYLDAIIGQNTSIPGFATFGQQIGFVIDGSWLVLVLCILVFMMLLPVMELRQQ